MKTRANPIIFMLTEPKMSTFMIICFISCRLATRMTNNEASEEEFRTDNLNSFYKVYNMFGPLQQ